MYNLCCKSSKATKLFFRKNIPEAVAGLLEEMRKAQDETYYHPQVSVCRWRLHWSQETMTIALTVEKRSGNTLVGFIATPRRERAQSRFS